MDTNLAEKMNLVDKEPKPTSAMLKRLQAHYRLKINGIPHFRGGRKEFVAPKDWVIEE